MRKIAIFLTVMIFASTLFAETIMIGSAKGYKRPMMKIYKMFEKDTGVKVKPIFGGIKQVISKVELSGKASIVIGDRIFLEKSKIDFDSFEYLGRGKLVLAYSRSNNIEKISDITDKKIKRIAQPHPKKTIYGSASSKYLENIGLNKSVKKKILTVSTVPQVSSYLILGEVDAGFTSLADALDIKDKIGGYIIADLSKYRPINVVAGIIKSYENDKNIKGFMEFLKSEKAKAVFESHGL